MIFIGGGELNFQITRLLCLEARLYSIYINTSVCLLVGWYKLYIAQLTVIPYIHKHPGHVVCICSVMHGISNLRCPSIKLWVPRSCLLYTLRQLDYNLKFSHINKEKHCRQQSTNLGVPGSIPGGSLISAHGWFIKFRGVSCWFTTLNPDSLAYGHL